MCHTADPSTQGSTTEIPAKSTSLLFVPFRMSPLQLRLLRQKNGSAIESLEVARQASLEGNVISQYMLYITIGSGQEWLASVNKEPHKTPKTLTSDRQHGGGGALYTTNHYLLRNFIRVVLESWKYIQKSSKTIWNLACVFFKDLIACCNTMPLLFDLWLRVML